MDINEKKEIILIMQKVVKNSRGSFTIKELKERIHKNLKIKNFRNVSENIDEVNSFIKKLKVNEKLFQYNKNDEKYFYIH